MVFSCGSGRDFHDVDMRWAMLTRKTTSSSFDRRDFFVVLPSRHCCAVMTDTHTYPVRFLALATDHCRGMLPLGYSVPVLGGADRRPKETNSGTPHWQANIPTTVPLRGSARIFLVRYSSSQQHLFSVHVALRARSTNFLPNCAVPTVPFPSETSQSFFVHPGAAKDCRQQKTFRCQDRMLL